MKKTLLFKLLGGALVGIVMGIVAQLYAGVGPNRATKYLKEAAGGGAAGFVAITVKECGGRVAREVRKTTKKKESPIFNRVTLVMDLAFEHGQ